LTPLIIVFTNSTSEYPNLLLFETSYKSPVSPPDSPLDPLGYNYNVLHLYFNEADPSFSHPGKCTITDALIPVPKLDGQVLK
jgi:hypothetical protein